jgi:serine/threonine protein kinase/dienelactone hydrolase
MTDERWTLVDRLLDAALQQEPADRDAFLQAACADDEALRREVQSLLAHHDDGTFLETPAVALLRSDASAPSRPPVVNQRLGVYEVLEILGAGGMGEVYRAHDPKLARDVAIKIIRPDLLGDADRRRRFLGEARAASTLNHPNVVTVHDIQQADGVDFIVMEYVRGQSLDRVIPEGGVPVERAVDYAAQIASALAEAHAAGIVHRDIKPGNVVVSESNRVKVLDFGLAKLVDEVQNAGPARPGVAAPDATRTGTAMGTPAYMSPEQVQRLAVDEKSDIFSFGATVYEMLTGRHPFAGDGQGGTLAMPSAIVHQPAPPLRSRRADVPLDVERLIDACLQKDPLARPSARDVARRLEAIRQRLASPYDPRGLLRRPVVALPVLALLVGVGALAWWRWSVNARIQWAHVVALPEIQRLADESQFDRAFRLAREALDVLPDDPRLRQLWLDVTTPASIRIEPPGADVAIKGYRDADASWYPLGRSPLENIRVPFGTVRLRISAKGFEGVEVAAAGRFWRGVIVKLDKAGTAPRGMVRVPEGPSRFAHLVAPLDEYWIDRVEATNRQFKAFIDAGGYRQQEYWREPFILDGRRLSWEEAIARFRDATGQPGPATWALGTYPEGQAEFPVSGVSWYEAAAYARFAGKSLPTLLHWSRAAGFGNPLLDIAGVSNFAGEGPARAGRYGGLGPFGTHDMAGNVTEWIWNQLGSRRLAIGGAWNQPAHMFWTPEARGPFERQADLGFRCVKYVQPPSRQASAPISDHDLGHLDLAQERPVGDETFKVYRSLYQYDRRALNASVDAIEDTPLWRKESVSFDAGYGDQRLRAYLFLPGSSSAPFQVIVGFPPGEAFTRRSSRDLSLRWAAFIIRSGRAFLYPVYTGTFERGPLPADLGPAAARDGVIAWAKEFRRSIDYLETRPDIDASRIGYYGISSGADAGLILTALEPRVRASALLGVGLVADKAQLPEAHVVNFAPRVRIPTLFLSGRNDIARPIDTVQAPLFRLLGTPREHKRHFIFEGGHIPARQQDAIREVLDWYDKCLGPVTTS